MDFEIYLIVFASGIIVGSIIGFNNKSNEIKQIKITLDAIVEHLGISSSKPENIDDELADLINRGKKVKAIKRYREVTGYGLKESKDYIDNLFERI